MPCLFAFQLIKFDAGGTFVAQYGAWDIGRGDCERIIYEWVHMDIDVNITYVRGMRAKAAHEAVHAQQMGNVFRTALQGIQQTAAFGCAPRATTERRLALCRSELLKEAHRVGLRAISAWQAEREDFKTSSKDYRSDPMEREAFAEEDKGERSGFPAGVEPPPEFRPSPPAPAPAR